MKTSQSYIAHIEGGKVRPSRKALGASLKGLARVCGSSSNLTPHADSYTPVPPVRFL
jgi:predicted transcriptional regulator